MIEVLVVLVMVVGVPLVWGIVLYNGLVRLKQMVMEGWSGIDVQLKRRANLVLPGKSRGTFDNVILSGGPYDPICTTTING